MDVESDTTSESEETIDVCMNELEKLSKSKAPELKKVPAKKRKVLLQSN